jgi:glycosyltransferase involved in cell wall biosynthesis
MNILYILANSLKINGGIGTATIALQKSLTVLGHSVKFCCHIAKISTDSFLLPDNSNAKSLKNIRFLNNLIKTENIDIVVNQFGQEKDFCFLCSKARIGTKTKLITCHHFALLMFLQVRIGLIAKILPKLLVYKLKKTRELMFRNFAYDNSDKLVLLSDKFIEQYRNLTSNKDLSKLTAIPDPLVFELPNIDLQKKQKTILFVGRIVEREKRISLVIELWRQICNVEKYSEWNLKIVGDGKDLYCLKQSAIDLPRISFEGYQNPVAYYEQSSIFLMCSYIDFEGFGMVLIEAQSCGCVPVAMNSWISIGDIIKDGENGFIVPYDNMEIFIDKTKILIDNEELRHKIARNCIESSKKFNTKIIAKKWEKLFFEVMNA